MMNLAELRGQLAEYQGRNSVNGHPQFLFRGQSAVYPSIKSTFARIPNSKMEIDQAHAVYCYAKRICQGLRGYTINHLDGAAVLQHYGWPTPLIDITGTLESAIFFALHGAVAESIAVVYVLDTRKFSELALVVDHDFLTHKLDEGALRHRWLRQDGFAVTTREWKTATNARDFDLLDSTFDTALKAYEFIVSDSDHAKLTDLISITDDPIPHHLQNLLRLFVNYQFEGELAPKLTDIIDEMWNVSAS